MNFEVFFAGLLEPLAKGVMAFISMTQTKEVEMVVAAIITLVGMLLCWEAPHHRMLIEERAKDGKLTEEQARRKISRLAWFGPMVTFAGVALLCGALMR